jgi:hypothetical protein
MNLETPHPARAGCVYLKVMRTDKCATKVEREKILSRASRANQS